MSDAYVEEEPTREEVDALPGATVVEFGANWCGICQGAKPVISAAMGEHSGVRHLRIADARGKRLGRSFGVKLWPTLVFLRDGREIARVVRPKETAEVTRALAQIVD